ncbi:MAG TPA: immune inhibitor A domain-containing protein, partial [Candidatus Limnocylindrales bacterium]|nr:immune inhibitor A domain-containing protein [Candidatus Limnocylindrales bacterium]
MRKLARTALAGVALGAIVTSLAAPVTAAPSARGGATAARPDNRPGPFTERQNARRKAAMDLILSGKASPNKDGVIALGDDKYYQAAVSGTGHIFTILAEFGDQGSGKLGRVPGPLHNQIPKPNRAIVDGQPNPDYDSAAPTDNSTHWVSDFNTAYYHDLFFGAAPSFKDFYEAQSSGNFTAAGDVSPWVTVPGNASTYGDNSVEDFGGAWHFIADAGNAWYAKMKADGQTDAQIKDYLAQFDVWDRNDYDNDGNFDEPDGYIDHFQAIHAGEGEEAGAPTWTIWSHRWSVQPYAKVGPDGNKSGGVQVGN